MGIFRHFGTTFDRLVNRAIALALAHPELKRRLDFQLHDAIRRQMQEHPNPLNRCGYKVGSQLDEDGILAAIIRRLPGVPQAFIEFGVDDGRECNSINLLFNEWKGIWIGKRDLCFTPRNKQLKYLQEFVTLETIDLLITKAVGFIGSKEIGLLSMDVDGNDYHFVKRILPSLDPWIIAVEYNGSFVPPAKFVMDYDAHHVWPGSGNFYGCALQSWIELLAGFGYALVCCNITGVNAFFVKREARTAFNDVPDDVDQLFQHPNGIWFLSDSHELSSKLIERYT